MDIIYKLILFNLFLQLVKYKQLREYKIIIFLCYYSYRISEFFCTFKQQVYLLKLRLHKFCLSTFIKTTLQTEKNYIHVRLLTLYLILLIKHEV